MAIVNRKSLALENADANPQVVNDSWLINSPVIASVDVLGADSNNSVYRFFRVPDTLVIKGIDVRNTAITNGTAYDLGLYDIDNGLVVNANVLGNDIAMGTARAAFADILLTTVINKPLYELLGHNYSQGLTYDLCFTGATKGDADGSIILRLII